MVWGCAGMGTPISMASVCGPCTSNDLSRDRSQDTKTLPNIAEAYEKLAALAEAVPPFLSDRKTARRAGLGRRFLRASPSVRSPCLGNTSRTACNGKPPPKR